jgi:hypothetical protein
VLSRGRLALARGWRGVGAGGQQRRQASARTACALRRYAGWRPCAFGCLTFLAPKPRLAKSRSVTSSLAGQVFHEDRPCVSPRACRSAADVHDASRILARFGDLSHRHRHWNCLRLLRRRCECWCCGVGTAADPARDAELPKSGDAELNQLRHLAVKAPLDDLFAKAMLFLSARVRAYPKDEILWQGVERMSRELVANEGRVVDQMVILVITGQIEGTARPPEPSLRDLVPVLRERREQARRRK